MMKAELLIQNRSQLGEGAYYDEQRNVLLWLDIFGCEVHELDLASGQDVCHKVEKPVTTIVPAETGYVVGMIDGVYRLDDDFKIARHLPSPDLDYAHYRCNDGKCGPDGRFWIGLMDVKGRDGQGALYVVNDEVCELAWTGFNVPNGIVWNSKQDKVYYTDSVGGRIYAFDYRDGKISNKKVIFHTDAGVPDGMTIDAEDKIWAAVWGSSCVYRIDPETGRILETVETPVPQVSSVAIAHRRLYITSATESMDEEQVARYPLSGSLFTAAIDVDGVPSFRYRGRA